MSFPIAPNVARSLRQRTIYLVRYRFRYRHVMTAQELERRLTQHGAAVVAAAHAVLRDEHLAQDVAQDVFLEHWRRPEAFDPSRGSLAAYLRLRSRSRAIDLLRARQAAARAVDRLEGDGDLGRAAEDAAETVDRRTRSGAVRAALRTLPAAQRQAVALTYLGGLSGAELATGSGVPLPTAKSRLRLGLLRMRHQLAAEAA